MGVTKTRASSESQELIIHKYAEQGGNSQLYLHVGHISFCICSDICCLSLGIETLRITLLEKKGKFCQLSHYHLWMTCEHGRRTAGGFHLLGPKLVA